MQNNNKPCVIFGLDTSLSIDTNAELLRQAIAINQQFASAWVIFNPSGDSGLAAIHDVLDNATSLPTKVVSDQPWPGIGNFLESVKTFADQHSDSMLWLKQHEKLVFYSEDGQGELALNADEDAGFILIAKKQFSIAELRLFSTRSDYQIVGEYKPTVDSPSIKYCSTRCEIYRGEHGLEIQGEAALVSLAAQRTVSKSQSAELAIYTSLINLSLADPDGAQHTLSEIPQALFQGNRKLAWTRAYLNGLIALAANQTSEASSHFSSAIEHDPGRVEPYARLAGLLIDANEFERAVEICELAEEISLPGNAHYLERDLYISGFRVIQFRALVRANKLHKARPIYTRLNPIPIKSNDIIKAIEEYDAAVALAKAAKSRTETPPSKQARAPSKKNKPAAKAPVLTIGMATHDDFDGVYFTLMSLKLFHADSLDEIELLVVDNNPDSKHGLAVKNLCRQVGARYLRAGEYVGTTVKERVFLEAKGDFVMCVDCHVFLHDGVVKRLLDYIRAHPNSKDIWHGPLVGEEDTGFISHLEERWQQGFYGVFTKDERAKDPDGKAFEIPMQGMALFVCKRSEWAGFNRKFRGFGGEEGYIHFKFVLNGGKTLCLPFLRWTHRFQRPNSPTYPNRWEDRIRNYLLGWDEVGRDTLPVYDHFIEQVGAEIVSNVQRALVAEQSSPFWQYDSVQQLAPSKRTPEALDHSLACWGLSYNAQIIEHDNSLLKIIAHIADIAARQNLPNIIIVKGTLPTLSAGRRQLNTELKEQENNLNQAWHFKADDNQAELLFVPSSLFNALQALHQNQYLRDESTDIATLQEVLETLAKEQQLVIHKGPYSFAAKN